jgi:hypothetical protein
MCVQISVTLNTVDSWVSIKSNLSRNFLQTGNFKDLLNLMILNAVRLVVLTNGNKSNMIQKHKLVQSSIVITCHMSEKSTGSVNINHINMKMKYLSHVFQITINSSEHLIRAKFIKVMWILPTVCFPKELEEWSMLESAELGVLKRTGNKDNQKDTFDGFGRMDNCTEVWSQMEGLMGEGY